MSEQWIPTSKICDDISFSKLLWSVGSGESGDNGDGGCCNCCCSVWWCCCCCCWCWLLKDISPLPDDDDCDEPGGKVRPLPLPGRDCWLPPPPLPALPVYCKNAKWVRAGWGWGDERGTRGVEEKTRKASPNTACIRRHNQRHTSFFSDINHTPIIRRQYVNSKDNTMLFSEPLEPL